MAAVHAVLTAGVLRNDWRWIHFERQLARMATRPNLLLPGLLLALGCGDAPAPLPREPEPEAAFAVAASVDVLSGLALREPMLVQHPSGSLFATGYSRAAREASDPPNLYSSSDYGVSWAPVDVGTVEDGALGNSDTDLIVDSAGVLHLLTMGFDRERAQGTHVSVGRSDDEGATWLWYTLSETPFDDRPWIGRSSSGRLHIVWNDGAGVRHATRPAQGGALDWTEGPRLHNLGGSSHMAMGPDGRIAVRITPTSASGNRFDREADFIAVSPDDGESWSLLDAPGERSWDQDFSSDAAVPRWVEPLAWTADGALHHLWSEGSSLWLATSVNEGRSWRSRPIVSGERPLYFPLLTPGPEGALGATWFAGRGEDLRAHAAVLQPAPGAHVVLRSPPLAVDAWQATPQGPERSPAGEYFPMVFLEGGDLGLVLPLQGGDAGDGFRWIRLSRRADG